MAKKRRVKVVRISHGLFNRANTRNMERAIQKWMSKGYELAKQDEHEPRGCLSFGYTLLTFIEREP